MGFKKRGGRESWGTRVIHAEFVGSLAGFGLDNSWDTGGEVSDQGQSLCWMSQTQKPKLL